MAMTSPRTPFARGNPRTGALPKTRFPRAVRTSCLSVLLYLALSTFVLQGQMSADRPCACPFGGGSWLLFEDSNRWPPVPDFWDLEEVLVDELSVCDHGVGFFFTSEQDENLEITALFFQKPTADLVRTRLELREESPKFEAKLERLERRYETLLERVDEHFANLMDDYGRVVFRALEMERPRILDPRHSLVFEWEGGSFELRGYMDVYFTPMI